MSEIINNCERTFIVLSPEEVLHRPYYLPNENGGRLHPSGEAIGDAIRRVAWKLLWMYGSEAVEGQKFDYGDIEVVDGKFVITFYKQKPEIPDEPGGP